MASMGMLGAMAGAAGGVQKGAMMQMEEDRERRLAEIRGRIQSKNQEASDTRRHQDRMAELKQQDEYSLQRHLQEDKDARARIDLQDEKARARTADDRAYQESNRARYEDILDKDGNIVGSRNMQTNEPSMFSKNAADQETFTWKEDTATNDMGEESTRGYQALGNRGTRGEYVPAEQSAQGGDIPTIETPAEAAKLPPGTVFRTPDGRTMRVPQPK